MTILLTISLLSAVVFQNEVSTSRDRICGVDIGGRREIIHFLDDLLYDGGPVAGRCHGSTSSTDRIPRPELVVVLLQVAEGAAAEIVGIERFRLMKKNTVVNCGITSRPEMAFAASPSSSGAAAAFHAQFHPRCGR